MPASLVFGPVHDGDVVAVGEWAHRLEIVRENSHSRRGSVGWKVHARTTVFAVGMLGVDFHVTEPPELVAPLAPLGRRYARSVAPGTR
jgi:hypothetical protein